MTFMGCCRESLRGASKTRTGWPGEQAFVAFHHDGHTLLDLPRDFNEVFDVKDGGHRNLFDRASIHLEHELIAAPEDQGVLWDHEALVGAGLLGT